METEGLQTEADPDTQEKKRLSLGQRGHIQDTLTGGGDGMNRTGKAVQK